MIATYKREMIESLNNTQSKHSGKNSDERKKVPVPKKETFNYIFENAKKGNEMAAVLLDEWQRSCSPKDKNEELIFRSINNAVNKIFI